jgi:hypothetical protein
MEETLRTNASRPLFTGVAVGSFAPWREPLFKISSKKLQKCFHMCTLRPLWCKAVRFLNLVASTYFQSDIQDITTRSVTNALLNPICSPASQEYEEVILPPSRVIPPRQSERLILVNELDELTRGSFPVCIPPFPSIFYMKPSLLGIFFPKSHAVYHLSNRLWIKRKYTGLRCVFWLYRVVFSTLTAFDSSHWCC